MSAALDLDRWPHLEAVDQELEREERRRAAVIAAWRAMRSQGVPAGSQALAMVTLRDELLRLGEVEEVYR